MYDISMFNPIQLGPGRPIQLVPTMKKELFTSSFQAKFLKIGFKKVARAR